MTLTNLLPQRTQNLTNMCVMNLATVLTFCSSRTPKVCGFIVDVGVILKKPKLWCLLCMVSETAIDSPLPLHLLLSQLCISLYFAS